MQTFTLKHSKKEVLIFVFDVFFRQFRETHPAKGCNKNVSLLYSIVVYSIEGFKGALNSVSIILRLVSPIT